MTTLTVDGGILDTYLEITPAPLVNDTILELWADYYQQEKRLQDNVYFDQFMSNPLGYCRALGIPPFPGHAGALPDFYDMRHLLPAQRLVMGRTA